MQPLLFESTFDAALSPLVDILSQHGRESLAFQVLLDRGKDYADRGLVQELRLERFAAHALVLGSEIYEVSLVVDQGDGALNPPSLDTRSSSCSCPFAQPGVVERTMCKHMAATAIVAAERYRALKESMAIRGALSEPGSLTRPARRL